MSRALQYLTDDLLVTWREGSNRIFLFLPPLLLLLGVFAWPALVAAYPAAEPYGLTALLVLAIQGGVLFGFITGFALLEEKDQGLLSVYRVAPIRFHSLLLLKIIFPWTATFVYLLLLLSLNSMLAVTGFPLLLAAFALSLLTPTMALLVGALGRNKVEGLTWFKGLDLLALVPLLGLLLPEAWKWAFSLLPTHWSVQAMASYEAGFLGEAYFFMGIAIFFQLSLVAFALRLLERRL